MRVLAAAFVLLFPLAASSAPLLFHGHGHGLAFSPDGTALLAPSEHGLAVYEDAGWSERALYSSGHAQPDRAARGLIRSTDRGRTWHAIALESEADFRSLIK